MEHIKKAIVKGLHEHLAIEVVPADTAAPKPKYPYLSYKAITPYSNTNGFSRTNDIIPSCSEAFEYDVLVTRTEQPQFTLSISAYSIDENEASRLSLNAADWFRFSGYELLKELDAVTVNVSNIGDRTVQIVDDYEKRYGFDVRLRVSRKITKTVETIENYTFNQEKGD